jgi:voltage-gated potassium channel
MSLRAPNALAGTTWRRPALSLFMRLLRSQTVDAGEVIVRVGEPAHSMYFIARGEIDIALKGRHIKLGVGHFFGEIAGPR